MVITSYANEQVMLLKKILSDKKYRREYRLYCVEGEKLVKEAFRFGKEVVAVYLRESASDMRFDGAKTVVVADNVFHSVSRTADSQGVAAVVRMPENVAKTPPGDCLILENVQDPGNVGTLLRSACATGFNNVYLTGCADVYSPKVLRSAMSAHFALDLFEGTFEEVFAAVREHRIVCADMQGENIFRYKRRGNVALVVGNEGSGLSERAKSAAHDIVSLPMENHLESLNVAVAGSVSMYLLKNGREEK